MSFITIKLWDLRRLILPTDYFTNKGLFNLTLQSTELLGTVLLYTDYTLPVEEVRNKFIELVNSSPFWNKKIAEMAVTEIKEMTLEVRCLMSADNVDDLWKLRCDMREELIKYIVMNFPDCLSKARNINYNKSIN